MALLRTSCRSILAWVLAVATCNFGCAKPSTTLRTEGDSGNSSAANDANASRDTNSVGCGNEQVSAGSGPKAPVSGQNLSLTGKQSTCSFGESRIPDDGEGAPGYLADINDLSFTSDQGSLVVKSPPNGVRGVDWQVKTIPVYAIAVPRAELDALRGSTAAATTLSAKGLAAAQVSTDGSFELRFRLPGNAPSQGLIVKIGGKGVVGSSVNLSLREDKLRTVLRRSLDPGQSPKGFLPLSGWTTGQAPGNDFYVFISQASLQGAMTASSSIVGIDAADYICEQEGNLITNVSAAKLNKSWRAVLATTDLATGQVRSPAERLQLPANATVRLVTGNMVATSAAQFFQTGSGVANLLRPIDTDAMGVTSAAGGPVWTGVRLSFQGGTSGGDCSDNSHPSWTVSDPGQATYGTSDRTDSAAFYAGMRSCALTASVYCISK